MSSILLIEDDTFEAQTLERHLGRAGHSVTVVHTAEEALALLGREIFDVTIVDLSLPGMSGLDFLREARSEHAVPVIVVTGDSDVASVVAAMRAGAQDYVVKPLTMKTLDLVLERVVDTARLRRHVERLSREVAIADPDPESTAVSPAMKRVLEQARRVAASDGWSALIVGESGVGKEVLAAYLHRCSPRASQPFVRINVAAFADTMIEAELFGAVRGAFTDAKRDRLGFFGAADGGTLLLDEVAELKPELQVKLLRVIETKRYYSIGATRERAVDVRIIAATNQDPAAAVARGTLRADLYYRLATIVLRVPPLRERPEDIAPLARAILANARRTTGRGPLRCDVDAMRALEEYAWPGNVRELKNAIERVAILVDSEVATRADLISCGIFDVPASRSPLPPPMITPWPPEASPYASPPVHADAAHRSTFGATAYPASLPPPLARAPSPSVPPSTHGSLPGASGAHAPSAIPLAHVPRGIRAPASDAEGTTMTLDEVARDAAERAEREHIAAVLEQTRGNRTRAAEILGVSRSTLWQKLRRLGIDDV
jgi:DNA-binding NtrC family response regulator